MWMIRRRVCGVDLIFGSRAAAATAASTRALVFVELLSALLKVLAHFLKAQSCKIANSNTLIN